MTHDFDSAPRIGRMDVRGTTRGDRGRRITRAQLTESEEAYVRKIETMGLVPCDFVRFEDGSLSFAASKKESVRRLPRTTFPKASSKKPRAQ